jgi:hypothetical protein
MIGFGPTLKIDLDYCCSRAPRREKAESSRLKLVTRLMVHHITNTHSVRADAESTFESGFNNRKMHLYQLKPN